MWSYVFVLKPIPKGKTAADVSIDDSAVDESYLIDAIHCDRVQEERELYPELFESRNPVFCFSRKDDRFVLSIDKKEFRESIGLVVKQLRDFVNQDHEKCVDEIIRYDGYTITSLLDDTYGNYILLDEDPYIGTVQTEQKFLYSHMRNDSDTEYVVEQVFIYHY